MFKINDEHSSPNGVGYKPPSTTATTTPLGTTTKDITLTEINNQQKYLIDELKDMKKTVDYLKNSIDTLTQYIINNNSNTNNNNSSSVLTLSSFLNDSNNPQHQYIKQQQQLQQQQQQQLQLQQQQQQQQQQHQRNSIILNNSEKDVLSQTLNDLDLSVRERNLSISSPRFSSRSPSFASVNGSNNNGSNNSLPSPTSSSLSISKVPKLHLKKDSSNHNLVKQWIDDTLRIKTDEKNVDSKIIKLDIGGKYYSTSLSTLTRHPTSMLGVMFSGRHELPKDKEGRIFIDRDGKLFGHILAFLRDGPLWNCPTDLELRRRIEIELSYYGLPGFSYGFGMQQGTSPMSTPRCVCGIKFQTLGQDTDHQGVWEDIPNMSTSIKSFRLIVSMNNILYAITERTHQENNSVTIQFEEYNSRSNSWTYVCPILDSMSNLYLAAEVVGDCIYAIPDAGLQQPIYKYDSKENKWKLVDTLLPSGKTSFSLVALDEYLYVIGGYKGSTTSDTVERYHPKSNSWCSVSNMLTKRAEGSAVVHDGFIYMIGGSSPNSTIERYNPHSNVWTFVCNLSTGRFTISTASCLEGKIYAIGSENDYDGLNIVLQYNPITNTWKRVAPLLYSTYNTYSSVVLDRYMFFIPWSQGGSVYRYEPCSC